MASGRPRNRAGRARLRRGARQQTYNDVQRQLRNIGGNVGVGGLAVAEGANAWNPLKALRPNAQMDPRIMHSFTTLFTTLDARIADVVEEGLQRHAYFLRVKVPGIVTNNGQVVARVQERYVSPAEADHAAIVGHSVKTLRRRISAGTLPASRFGPRSIRVRLADLEATGHGVPNAAL